MKWTGVVALVLLLSGCMTAQEMSNIMDSWKGSHISDLIASWGPPQQLVPDGKGGKIYIWRQQASIPLTQGKTTERGSATAIGSTVYYNSKTTYTPGTNIEIDRTRMFWVNRRGIIYNWQWKGL